MHTKQHVTKLISRVADLSRRVLYKQRGIHCEKILFLRMISPDDCHKCKSIIPSLTKPCLYTPPSSFMHQQLTPLRLAIPHCSAQSTTTYHMLAVSLDLTTCLIPPTPPRRSRLSSTMPSMSSCITSRPESLVNNTIRQHKREIRCPQLLINTS